MRGGRGGGKTVQPCGRSRSNRCGGSSDVAGTERKPSGSGRWFFLLLVVKVEFCVHGAVFAFVGIVGELRPYASTRLVGGGDRLWQNDGRKK